MIIFDDISAVRFLSRLDPRVSIASVFLFAVLICLCHRVVVLAAGLGTGVFLLSISGVPAKRVVKRLLALNAFMLLLAITLPVFASGIPLFRLGRLGWSAEGFFRVAQIAARANAVMIMLTALLGTMEAPHLGFALNGVGVPSKFTHLLLFMVRYIEVIHHEYHRLWDAMLLRGFRPRCDRHTLRAFGYLIGQLLVRSVNRSERILDAMKCRGFLGRFYVLSPCRISGGDLAFAAVALVCMFVLIIMEWQCGIL